MKEMPESRWITSSPGTGGSPSKTGIRAMTPAAATAAHSATQNHMPCVRASPRNRLRATGRARSSPVPPAQLRRRVTARL